MVDLGFLLITFFIFTTALTQSTVIKLVMTKDTKVSTPIKETNVLTLILKQNDSVLYFEGKQHEYNYCKIIDVRSVIQRKQLLVSHLTGGPSETVLIIYPGAQSTYKNFVDVLDEIQINDVKHYYIMNNQLG